MRHGSNFTFDGSVRVVLSVSFLVHSGNAQEDQAQHGEDERLNKSDEQLEADEDKHDIRSDSEHCR